MAEPWIATDISHQEWAALSLSAPQMAATMRRYLVQLATFLAPRSVDVADSTLRQVARWLADATDVRAVAEISRGDIEDFKVWLATQPGCKAPTLSKNTQRQRLRMIRIFFELLIEWDWPDAPRRNPILHGDIPPRPEPLPKFLDDRDAAKLMAAARAHPDPRTRLVVEILARTGLRASELCDLAADAVTQIGEPTGSPRRQAPQRPVHPAPPRARRPPRRVDRNPRRRHPRPAPAHRRSPRPDRAAHRPPPRRPRRQTRRDRSCPPHQLRHTLATQAINRGMRLEAIAALLGHRSMEMTLTLTAITRITPALRPPTAGPSEDGPSRSLRRTVESRPREVSA